MAAASPLGMKSALTALWSTALKTHPEGWVPRERFTNFVTSNLTDEHASPDGIATLWAADAYLACACADGHPEAIQAFEAKVIPVVRTAMRARGVQASTLDEVMQCVRERLLAPRPGRPPRIAMYGARGELHRWVKATAVRTHVDMIRSESRDSSASDEKVLDAVCTEADDPELAHMKREYRTELRDAFAEALTTLRPRQLLVLRYRFVDRVPVEHMAATLDVHRVTAHRWIKDARDALAQATLGALKKKLALTDSDLVSFYRLVESQIDLRVSTAFLAADQRNA